MTISYGKPEEDVNILPSQSIAPEHARVVPHIPFDEDVEDSLTYWYCREVRLAAIDNFARLNRLNLENVTHDDVLKLSAGVLVWSFADV